MTIKDLAKETGYSVGTISRVLNNQPNVSQKARDAILAIVHERGFQLNTNAKTLKQQRSNCIAAVVKGTANEMFASLVEQLQERSADRTLGQRCHGLHLPFLPIMPQTVNFCKEKTSKKTGPSGEAS